MALGGGRTPNRSRVANESVGAKPSANVRLRLRVSQSALVEVEEGLGRTQVRRMSLDRILPLGLSRSFSLGVISTGMRYALCLLCTSTSPVPIN
jgi:hypothetical protein